MAVGRWMMGEQVAGSWRALRRRIITPDISATKLDVRGFHVKSPAAKELLETVGASFLRGYAYAAEAPSVEAAVARLETVPTRFRGFAYEGAAMGFAVLDALPLGGSGRVSRFVSGAGAKHVYMAYVGMGWAMARVPRFRWSAIAATDPLLRWLALDGYGFHQAYFRTQRYVHEMFQEEPFPWPADDHRWYAARAIDQGIGRAMWFVGGTSASLVADMIDRFPAHRRADLYAGAGLAATYAGGADEEEMHLFRQRAGEYRAHLAQGSAFAASARVTAGLVVEHTARATAVFCGMTPREAAGVCDETRPHGQRGTDIPAYEIWRRDIAAKFISLGRC